MTKIEFLIAALKNNANSMSFFEDCSICPLREECRRAGEEEMDLDNYKSCTEFLNEILED